MSQKQKACPPRFRFWCTGRATSQIFGVIALVLATLAVVLSLLGVFNTPINVRAGYVKEFNFQGRLTNPDGTNVDDGTYDMTFKIYDVASGGIAKWTEVHNGGNKVTVEDGVFNVNLGSITAIGLDFNSGVYYLGIEVNGDGEMTPRRRIGGVGYALNAERVYGVPGSLTDTNIDSFPEAERGILDALNYLNTTVIPAATLWSDTGAVLRPKEGVSQNVSISSGTLSVAGAVSFSSTLGVTGAATLSSSLGVSGATTLSSTLAVSGATTLSSTLGVTGTTTLSGILNANGVVNLGDGGDAVAVSGTTVGITSNGSNDITIVSGDDLTFRDTRITTAIPFSLTDNTAAFEAAFGAADRGIVDALVSLAAGGSGLWTLTGSIIHPATLTNDVAVGAASLVAPFSVDESLNTVRIGEGSAGAATNAILNMYGSDDDTGSITYTTDDRWEFTGGNIYTNGVMGIGVAPSAARSLNIANASDSGYGVYAAMTGTVGTIHGGYFSATGAATTNRGIYATASGATSNYAGIFDAGNVGIGDTAPGSKLMVNAGTLAGGQDGISFTATGPAGDSADGQQVNFTAGIMNGGDTQRGLAVAVTNADHSAGVNWLYGLEVDGIAGDAEANEYGIFVGAGWDYAAYFTGNVHATGAISSGATITIDGSVNPGTITATTAMTITATSGNLLLATNTSGNIVLNGAAYIQFSDNIDSDIAFEGPQAVTTSSGDLTLNPSGDVAFSSNSLTGMGTNITATAALTVTSTGAASDLALVAGRDITFDDDNLLVALPMSVADTALDASLTQGIVDAINDLAAGSAGLWKLNTAPTPDIIYSGTTYDVVIGGDGSTLAAPFSVDVSAQTARIGSGATANGALAMYGSDGDTGSITYTTDDRWTFTGGDAEISSNVLSIGTTPTAGYSINISNTAAGGRGVNVAMTVGTGTVYGIYSSATATATTNYGIYTTTSGAAENYGGYFTVTGATGNKYALYAVISSANDNQPNIGMTGDITTAATHTTYDTDEAIGVKGIASINATINYGGLVAEVYGGKFWININNGYTLSNAQPTRGLVGFFYNKGTVSSSTVQGIHGWVDGDTGDIFSSNTLIGVQGGIIETDSPATYNDNQAYGIYGMAKIVNTGTGNNFGVYGEAASANTSNYGVYGYANANSGTKYGVYGIASGTGTNYGIYATASGGTTNWAGYFNAGNVNIIGDLYMNSTATIYSDRDADFRYIGVNVAHNATYPLYVSGDSYLTGGLGVGTTEANDGYIQATRIGLGVTPSYPLHVSGTGYITGNVGIGTAPATYRFRVEDLGSTNSAYGIYSAFSSSYTTDEQAGIYSSITSTQATKNNSAIKGVASGAVASGTQSNIGVYGFASGHVNNNAGVYGRAATSGTTYGYGVSGQLDGNMTTTGHHAGSFDATSSGSTDIGLDVISTLYASATDTYTGAGYGTTALKAITTRSTTATNGKLVVGGWTQATNAGTDDSSIYGLVSIANGTAGDTVYGAYGQAGSAGSATTNYGVYATIAATGTSTGSDYGGYFNIGNDSGGTDYIVYANAGTNVEYGLYINGATTTAAMNSLQTYSDTVGVTNRDLYIDNTGKIGYVSSSMRYKKNVKSLPGVAWLYELRPVNFEYKKYPGAVQAGLIAEEVAQVNPAYVSYNNQGQPETVSYGELVTPLIQSAKEQEAAIVDMNEEMDALKKQMEILTAKVASGGTIQPGQVVGDLGVTGKVTIGLDLDVTGTIKASSLWSQNATWHIDSLGEAVFQKVTAGDIELIEGENKALGSVVLPGNQREIFVPNTSVTAASRIFLTIESVDDANVSVKVKEKRDKQGFVISTLDGIIAPVDLPVNWLIVN